MLLVGGYGNLNSPEGRKKMWNRIKSALRRVIDYTVEANDTTYYSGAGWSNPIDPTVGDDEK